MCVRERIRNTRGIKREREKGIFLSFREDMCASIVKRRDRVRAR